MAGFFIAVIRPGLKPGTYCLAYRYGFRRFRLYGICGLDYNFTIAGVSRLVSTEPFCNLQPDLFSCADYSEMFLPLK